MDVKKSFDNDLFWIFMGMRNMFRLFFFFCMVNGIIWTSGSRQHQNLQNNSSLARSLKLILPTNFFLIKLLSCVIYILSFYFNETPLLLSLNHNCNFPHKNNTQHKIKLLPCPSHSPDLTWPDPTRVKEESAPESSLDRGWSGEFL